MTRKLRIPYRFAWLSWVLFIAAAFSPNGYSGVLPQSGDARYELVFWESIKDSNLAEEYEAYIKEFPNGRFVPLAKIRIKKLRDLKKKNSIAAEKNQKDPKGRKSSLPTDPAVSYRINSLQTNDTLVAAAALRTHPSKQSKLVKTLKSKEQVLISGKVVGHDWYQVELTDGSKGFVYAEHLRSHGGSLRQSSQQRQNAPGQRKISSNSKGDEAHNSNYERFSTQPRNTESSNIANFSLEEPLQASPKQAVVSFKLKELKDCDMCPALVALPTGTFMMGSKIGDRSEKPLHTVQIRQPFAIGKYEITVQQWKHCVQAGACSYKAEKAGKNPQSPVRNISWTDAQQYIGWLSKKTGRQYRLPSEAEWEYAARGGTSSRYWWGNQYLDNMANCRNCGGDYDRHQPSQVGAYPANPFGLYDTSGGVWEWVADCWHNSYDGAPKDGKSWKKSGCSTYVIRGGSWRDDTGYMHSGSRFKYDKEVRYLAHGFRIARSISQKELP